MKTRTTVFAITGIAAMTLSAADVAVGKWERATIDADVNAADSVFVNPAAGSLSVVSGGEVSLPSGSVVAFGDNVIGVRSGTLAISDSAGADFVANPPAELQNAALWLDAGKNLATNVIDTQNCVSGWYDARESSAAAANYGYAVSVSGAGSDVPTFLSVDGTLPSVNFLSHVAGANHSLVYRTSGGSAAVYNIRHAFYVQSFVSSNPKETAPVLGSQSGYIFSPYNTYASLRTDCLADPVAYASEYLLDGVPSDPTESIPSGTHVYEFTLPSNMAAPIDSLMSDKGNYSGGHCLHELLLFTTPLSSLERMRITAYLRSKWMGVRSEPFKVDTAAGTTVKLAAGTRLSNVAVVGDGRVTVPSGATVTNAYRKSGEERTRVPCELADSTAKLVMQAEEYEYAFAGGETVAITESSRVSALTKSSGVSADAASVTSPSRPVVVTGLASGISKFAVNGGGDLILRASSRKSGYIPGTVSAATFGATSLSLPAGSAGVETTVNVPADGDWEIEFKMYNDLTSSIDTGYGEKGAYRVQLVSGGSVVWERIPTVLARSAYGNVDQSRRYLVRNLASGMYTFRVVGYESDARAASMSDLSMSFVPNVANETVIPVKDGDFESSRFRRPYYAALGNNTRTAGWTFDAAGDSNPALSTIVSSAMGHDSSQAYSKYMFRSSQLGRYGDNALLWYHNSPRVTSPETVLASAGRYNLRLDAVRWMTGTNYHSKVNNRCNSAPTLAASVKINGGEAVSLGSISPSGFVAANYSFPQAFDVAANDKVVVCLEQTVSTAGLQIDNLEFVKVDDVAVARLGDELVVNGSVERGSSGWNFEDYYAPHRIVSGIWNPLDAGTSTCDGAAVIRSANGARAWQTVAMPAGTFRLSFWARPREVDGSIKYQSRLSFWYVEPGSSATNTIYESDLLWSSEFLERSALFSVPAAGTYVFGFNTENMGEGGDAKDAFVDCVSVRQVLESDATPDISENAAISLSGGGKLRLDYTGCLNLDRLRVNGRPLIGEVSAEKYPDLIVGPGKALVKEHGAVLIVF